MPKTKGQEIIFGIMMVSLMVYGMVVYNISIATGGISADAFIEALKELPIMIPIAFAVEFLLLGRVAKKMAFAVINPFNDSFKVQFYGINIKGKPTTFYINNKFPIESNFNLKFMKPLENEAYGIILEKAWASLVGGYKNIDGGRAYKVLNKLLGIMKKWKF